eukprot:12931164-Prorocentrum_lima.AAC.1
MGTFTGGLLWTEHGKGPTQPPFEAKGMEPSVKGKVFVTNSKWHKFDGTKWHGVTPAKGYTLSFVYFNSKALDNMSEDDWQQLEALVFHAAI